MSLASTVAGGITIVVGSLIGWFGIVAIQAGGRTRGPLPILVPRDWPLQIAGVVLFVIGSVINTFGLRVLGVLS